MCLSDFKDKFLFNEDSIFIENSNIIEYAIKYIVKTLPSTADLREIARTEPWSTIYSINKDNLFGLSAVDMTYEQKTLIAYSRMYDNASKHPNSPIRQVIDDDDMFDGWCIVQAKEQEKEHKDSFVKENVRHGNAGEVFVMANADDISAVNELNDFNTRMKRASRDNLIKKKGTIHEQELPDVQMELRRQLKDEVSKRKG